MSYKILIVEDELIEAMNFEQSLTSFDYEVVGIASTGDEALKMVADLEPDLVLMDIVLKGEMDGIEAAAKIKEEFNTPLIYLTAHPEQSAINRAKLTSPYGYLIKPVSKTDLKNTIELALYKHEMDKTVLASEKRFFGIAEGMIDGLIITQHGIIDYVNPAMIRLLKADSVDELLGKNFLDFLTPSSKKIAIEEMQRKQEGKEFTENLKEYELMPIKGSPITCEVKLSSQQWEGKIYGVSIYRDITETKKAEKALSESEEKYKNLFESNPDYTILINPDGVLLDVNDAVERFTGLSKDELIGKTFLDLGIFPEEDLDLISKNFSQRLRKRKIDSYRSRFIDKNGDIHWVLNQATNIMKDDKIDYVLLIGSDITEYKKAEDKLKDNASRFRAVAESAVDAIVTTDENGNIIFFNHSLMDIFGYRKGEMTGKPLTILMPHRFRESYLNELQKFKESGEHRLIGRTASTTGLRKDGSEFPFEMSLASWKSGEKTFFTSIIRDITKQKITEEQTKDQLKKLTILNQVIDMANNATSFDDLLKEIVHSTMELLGFNSGGIYLLEGNKRFVELVYHENFPTSILENNSRANIEEMPFSKLYGDKKPLYYNSESAPSIVRTGFKSVAIVPLYSAGKIIGSISIASSEKTSVTDLEMDILESIGLEAGTVIAKMYSEKAIKDSLHEKEVLLKEIHHRVKNNLQIISSLLDLQESYVKEDPTAVNVLEESKNRVISMAMIHEMLYQSEDLSRINFSDYIRNIVLNLFDSYGAKAIVLVINVDEIYLNIETSVPLGLIISELVSNSLKYAFTDDVGEISVSLKHKGGEYKLKICDNGIGLPEEINFSTESTLGLRLVNSLVSQLDGTLQLKRTNGTQYTFTFKELKYNKRI
ncbi:MAG: PAS domain S-box protein [Methanobacterium sp.]|nr:PAS domain S-box protein [Methanobacterium sp.]